MSVCQNEGRQCGVGVGYEAQEHVVLHQESREACEVLPSDQSLHCRATESCSQPYRYGVVAAECTGERERMHFVHQG